MHDRERKDSTMALVADVGDGVGCDDDGVAAMR